MKEAYVYRKGNCEQLSRGNEQYVEFW